jgi:pimeloyl-ACP methyl ester carboxylesterase
MVRDAAAGRQERRQLRQAKLTMPVLAIGASASLGSLEATQVREYATNVTGTVIQDSGHWIYEEHPAELTRILVQFLRVDAGH